MTTTQSFSIEIFDPTDAKFETTERKIVATRSATPSS
jgi:hypothetical protein